MKKWREKRLQFKNIRDTSRCNFRNGKKNIKFKKMKVLVVKYDKVVRKTVESVKI